MDATTTQIERYRCTGSKCLRTAEQLVNMRPAPNGRTDYVIASGPCGKCGAGGHITFGEYGPADLTNTYTVVGVKVTRMPNVRCTRRCMHATNLDCKCSCGGERHGVAAA